MKTAMESLKEMVDVNTVVGDPVETQDGQVIVPVSRVAFGFAAGGGEYGDLNSAGRQGQGRGDQDGGVGGAFPFGGGSGAGVSVQPVGFLIVGHDSVRLLPVDGQSAVVDRLIDLAPQMLDRVQGMMGGGGKGREKDGGPSIDRALERIPGNGQRGGSEQAKN